MLECDVSNTAGGAWIYPQHRHKLNPILAMGQVSMKGLSVLQMNHT